MGRLAIGLLAAALLGVMAPPADADPERRDDTGRSRTLTVVDHNIEKKGFGPGWGVPDAPGRALDYALLVAQRSRADVITLQEVCADQLTRLRREHGRRWTIAWSPRTTNCYRRRLDGSFAAVPVGEVAIWTRGPGGVASVVDLRNGDETFAAAGTATVRVGNGPALTCVTARRYRTVFKACSTHLPASGGIAYYAARIKQITDPWIDAGYAVVIGGDLNAQPSSPELDWLYRKGRGPGRFMEAGQRFKGTYCRCGARTDVASPRPRKIDYVFLSENRVSRTSPRSLVTLSPRPAAGYSDHRVLLARAQVLTNR